MNKKNTEYDAVIIGSGPNGLSSAILLAQHGLSVKVIEGKDTIGGGTRTMELTEPGFIHDVCSAVHPTAIAAPYLKTLPLDKYGLEWCFPEFAVAHPLDNGKGIVVNSNLDETIQRLGSDGKKYERIVKPLVDNWNYISHDLFGPIRIPKHPTNLTQFGLNGIYSARGFANKMFKNEETRAFFAGLAAHSILPLTQMFTASFGIIFAASIHTADWPVAKGGSSSITDAMAAYLRSLGGKIETGRMIEDINEVPNTTAVIFDLTPHQIARIADSAFPYTFTKRLMDYKYGPGIFKMDFALNEPVPWQNKEARGAGTLHLGGTFDEIAKGEQDSWDGVINERPYVLVSQPSLFDDTRAPAGKHTLWAYCHVPNGSDYDCTEIIINQIERFAPGFRDTIISYSTINAPEFEAYNPNYIGGDINGGAQFFKQLIGRPLLKWDPYKLAGKGMYICSSATPPGGGVHGMGGFHAAKSVLKNEFDIKI